MDQLTALRALRRVVELGSFTAAGAALGISHSIVSRQIRQLESQLGSSRTLAVASPAYLARHGHPATPQDLAQHNCLMYSSGEKPAEWSFTDAGGAAHKIAVRGSLQANTSVALREAAVGGMGIAGAAGFIVRDALRSGQLVEVLPGYTLRPRTLYALYPHSRQLSPKVRVFVDFAVQHYQNRRWD